MPDDVLNGILDSASNDQSATSTGRTPLVIDSDLRTIQVPIDYVFGVQNDKDVLSVPFVVPRYYDGVDLSELSIRVNFTTKSGLSSYYDVDTIIINSDTIEFSWLLGAAVFVSVGDLTFAVCIRQVEADGRITREFNTTLATAKILPGLEVENPEDPSQYSILVQMQNIAERAESYVGAPLTALTEDDMTDTSRIYVYVGEETGYTNGHWYYYSEDVWHDGGIYNAVAQLVDNTLTEEGVAADAKATGDAIAELDNSIQNGIHPDLYAGNLTTDKAQTDRTPYLQRGTCNESGSSRIGQRCYDTLIGASVGENQLYGKTGNSTNKGITFTNVDGKITISGVNDGTGTSYYVYNFTSNIPANHVVAFRSGVNGGSSTTYDAQLIADGGSNELSYDGKSYIVTKKNYPRKGCNLDVRTGYNADQNPITFAPEIIDLTAELGSSIADYIYTLESATAGSGIAKLREWGFLRGYQAFNAGSLESVEVTGKVVRGFNQYDKDASYLVSGSAYRFCDIPFGENHLLYASFTDKDTSVDISGCSFGVCYSYDPNNNSGYKWLVQNGVVRSHTNESDSGTIPSRTLCKYIFVYPNDQSTWDKLNQRYDICVNIYNEDRNGEYEPYTSQTYALGSDKLRGIFKLDANNNLYADGDVKTADGTITRKYKKTTIESVSDVGTSSAGVKYAAVGIVSDAKSDGYIMSAFYQHSSNASTDKSIRLITNTLYVYDNRFTDNATAKSILIGMEILYELATPTTETSTPFTSPQVCYPYGTEEFITETPVPVGHETIYPYDLKAQAERLIDVPDVPSTNGTYTLKATRSASGITYSWVSG